MTLKDLSVSYLKDMAPPVLEKTTYHDYKRKLELRILPRISESLRKDDV